MDLTFSSGTANAGAEAHAFVFPNVQLVSVQFSLAVTHTVKLTVTCTAQPLSRTYCGAGLGYKAPNSYMAWTQAVLGGGDVISEKRRLRITSGAACP